MSSRGNSVFFEDMGYIQNNLDKNIKTMSWKKADQIKKQEIKDYILRNATILLRIKKERDERRKRTTGDCEES